MVHPMKTISLEKLTLNIGAGEPGDRLEKSSSIMETIVGKPPVRTKNKKRNTFGGVKGRNIGVKITLRGAEAESMLKRLLHATENKLPETVFDSTGNFSFGVKEYINIQGVKYDPEIGIMGLDVAVTLQRPGFRVRRRRLQQKPIGQAHRITRDEAIEWAKGFGITILKEGEE